MDPARHVVQSGIIENGKNHDVYMCKREDAHTDSTIASDGNGECTENSDRDSTDDHSVKPGYRFFFSNRQGKREEGNRLVKANKGARGGGDCNNKIRGRSCEAPFCGRLPPSLRDGQECLAQM